LIVNYSFFPIEASPIKEWGENKKKSALTSAHYKEQRTSKGLSAKHQ